MFITAVDCTFTLTHRQTPLTSNPDAKQLSTRQTVPVPRVEALLSLAGAHSPGRGVPGEPLSTPCGPVGEPNRGIGEFPPCTFPPFAHVHRAVQRFRGMVAGGCWASDASPPETVHLALIPSSTLRADVISTPVAPSARGAWRLAPFLRAQKAFHDPTK